MVEELVEVGEDTTIYYHPWCYNSYLQVLAQGTLFLSRTEVSVDCNDSGGNKEFYKH